MKRVRAPKSMGYGKQWAHVARAAATQLPPPIESSRVTLTPDWFRSIKGLSGKAYTLAAREIVQQWDKGYRGSYWND